MGILSDFQAFRNSRKQQLQYAQMMNGSIPIFTQFGADVYASDIVQQAVNCIVSELSKLQPQHVRENAYDVTPVTDSQIQWVLENPNTYMTTKDFLEKISWNLLLKFNSFIIPHFVNGQLMALYPISPEAVTFYEDNKTGYLLVGFKFGNNDETILDYKDVIHIRYRYAKNELMGGNQNGNPDLDSLLKILQVNHTLIEGLEKNLKMGYAIQGVVQGKTMMNDKALKQNLEQIIDILESNKNGFLMLDSTTSFMPFSRNIQAIDPNVLQFIDSKILRNWSISLPILTGDYTKEQYEAFYQKAIEPIVISFSQAFTKCLFSDREKGFGNKIRFYTEELSFLSTQQKLEFVKEVAGRGALTNGKILSIFGINALHAGPTANKRFMSLNYVDVDIANQYQLNNAGAKADKNTGGEKNE